MPVFISLNLQVISGKMRLGSYILGAALFLAFCDSADGQYKNYKPPEKSSIVLIPQTKGNQKGITVLTPGSAKTYPLPRLPTFELDGRGYVTRTDPRSGTSQAYRFDPKTLIKEQQEKYELWKKRNLEPGIKIPQIINLGKKR